MYWTPMIVDWPLTSVTSRGNRGEGNMGTDGTLTGQSLPDQGFTNPTPNCRLSVPGANTRMTFNFSIRRLRLPSSWNGVLGFVRADVGLMLQSKADVVQAFEQAVAREVV